MPFSFFRPDGPVILAQMTRFLHSIHPFLIPRIIRASQLFLLRLTLPAFLRPTH